MGYSTEHVERTRRRILDSAASHFRREGFERASIDQIMAGAGLTRGGFYAHFRSKQDLFAAVLRDELEFTRQLRIAQERSPGTPLSGAHRAVAYYLAPDNQKKIAQGCTIVSNAADIARARKPARSAFTESFRELATEFEALVASDLDAPKSRALAALATCVGGVVLAQALSDPALIKTLLGACHERATETLAGTE